MRTTRTTPFLALLLLPVLAACGGDADDASASASETTTTVAAETVAAETEGPTDGVDAAAFEGLGEELCTVVTDAEIDALVEPAIDPLFVTDALGSVSCQWFAVEGVDIAASFSIVTSAPYEDIATATIDFIDGAYEAEVAGHDAYAVPGNPGDIIAPDAEVGVALAGSRGPTLHVNADDDATALAVAELVLPAVLELAGA
jgi:hypothetical protein